MFTIVSTRFNNDTWNENRENRRSRNIPCIYGTAQEMSPKIDYNATVFVIEMNNSLNCIEGIGLIKNLPDVHKKYNIYADANYNRYIYKSNYHIDRCSLIKYNENLVTVLEQILFKGKTHLKRGTGFTTIPEKLMNHKICEQLGINIKQDIKNIFIQHFRKEMNEEMNEEINEEMNKEIDTIL